MTGRAMPSRAAGAVAGSFDVEKIRAEFPILRQKVSNGKTLVYLDNAATSQKPLSVIDATSRYYAAANANIHRGVHHLSEEATKAYEGARSKIRAWINAGSAQELIFVRGTTEAINLVAATLGAGLRPGDEVAISALEHHSNIVPWQLLCEQRQARLRVVPMNDRGELLLDEYERILTGRVRIVALSHVSNALGTITPVKEMTAMAHRAGAVVLIDGAQAVPHMAVDVRDLDCDFYAFSGHKMYGPTGVGILYGRKKILESLPPYQSGGDMIKSVTFEKTIFNDLPFRFEAGTPNIAGGIGLGAAVDYLGALDMDALGRYEHELVVRATEALEAVPGVRIIGTAAEKAGVVSFVVENIHPHDIGTILDSDGVAIRTGHHCAQPIMLRFGIPATARASFALYNTFEEVDVLARSVRHAIEVMG
jgi:cysteine desulfurase/selenocysteine lyase